MKIDEFMNKTKGLVPRVKIGKAIYICSNDWDMSHDNYFLVLDTKKDNLIEYENWGNCEKLTFDRLRWVLNLVQKLRDTPVDERFPAKKYYLRWITDDDGTPNYLHNVDGTWDWSSTKAGTKVFTKEELQQLKINNPRFAPAIDAMKEPVEDNA